MNRILSLILVAIALSASHSQADQASLDRLVKKEQANVDNEAVTVYGGRVGNLEAVFFIEWSGVGNPIDGYYYYPSRGSKKRYKLKGSNPKDGELLLTEFTPTGSGAFKTTARCSLTKRVTESRILWEGTMNNTDGRELPMEFSRPR